jgi:hypothetical protein
MYSFQADYRDPSLLLCGAIAVFIKLSLKEFIGAVKKKMRCG